MDKGGSTIMMKGTKILAAVTLCLFSIVCAGTVMAAGTMSFIADKATYAVGEDVVVQIKMNTDGASVGVFQIRANFDTALLSLAVGDIVKDATTWPDPAPEPPSVAGNLFKFTGGKFGAGNNGADLLIGTITFKALAEGSAAITFVGGDDFTNSTMALDATTFTNILTTLNNATITIGAAGTYPKNWNFDADEEGWQFSGQVGTFTVLTEEAAGGAISLTSTNNTDSFGFWYSPADAVSEIDDATQLYKASFDVVTDQEKAVCPSIRFRWNATNQAQGDVLHVNSNDAGEAMPGKTNKTYDLYFRPQNEAIGPTNTQGTLAFDLINFNANDAAAAKVSLNSVALDRIDVSTLGAITEIAQWTFDGDEEGWTDSTGFDIGTLTHPTFGWVDSGAIGITTADNNSFGFWAAPLQTLEANKMYIVHVNAGVDITPEVGKTEKPSMRIRLFDSQNHVIGMLQTPVWTLYEKPARTNEVTFNDYYAYFVNQGGPGAQIGIQIDMVNLGENSPSVTQLIINEVTISSASIPTF